MDTVGAWLQCGLQSATPYPFIAKIRYIVRSNRGRLVHMLQNAGAAASAPNDLIKDTTTQAFMADVIEESKRQPVLVDFWAPWCGPCKQLTPVIEKVVRAAKGKVKLTKMNIDDHPAIPGQLGIQSIPAVIAFVNGQPADGFLGALPESQVVAFLERLTKGRIGGEEADLLKAADAALVDGDPAGAAEIYAQLLTQDGGNVHALAGLARCYVETGALEQARQTLAMVPQAKANDGAVAAARAALELAEQAQSLGPIAELEQKVAADPADHQARFDLAVALNGKGRRQEAVNHLLEIVRRNRQWNDDGARKQLVQFFEAWGPTDEATVDGRRRLSSILFA
jgi:putative thioredoxin